MVHSVKRPGHAAHIAWKIAVALACICALAVASSCTPSSDDVNELVDGLTGGPETVDGVEFSQPDEITQPSYNADGEASIDTSFVSEGYVCAAGISAERLKFQVTKDEETYNYDLPNDGTPTVFPINMGDGYYMFRIMQNTDGSNYVEIACVDADVALYDEFAPFLLPNVFCDYNPDSACVAKASELTSGSSNVGEAVRDVCSWVANNVTYDTAKAEELSGGSGYIPSPDETLASQSGICFDYASLTTAMLRSMGIPTKLVTGYVGEDELYHAWIMVYIDGEWHSALFSVDRNTWSRCDVTFASTGSTKYTGDASAYTDRYTY